MVASNKTKQNQKQKKKKKILRFALYFIIYPISLPLFTDKPHKVLLTNSLCLLDPFSSPHILSLTQFGPQSPLFHPDCSQCVHWIS